MSDARQPDVSALLREILLQQTAMLQIQAESVRLQRVLVERLVAVSTAQPEDPHTVSIAPAIATANLASGAPTASGGSVAVSNTAPTAAETPANAAIEETPEPQPVEAESDLPFAPAPADQHVARGARYH